MTTPTPEYRSFALTEAEVNEINWGLSYAEQHHRIPTDPPQAISGLDWNTGANRWAAFTNDELAALHAAQDWDAWKALEAEIASEIDRREAP